MTRGAAPGLGWLAWPEVPARPIVLVPLGSTEQHGPHLPFDTDTVIARAVAEGTAALLASAGDPVVVAPAIAYGSSGEHQHFAGTVSIGTAALGTLLLELGRSLATWAERIIVVNGHGGNADALRSAIPELRRGGADGAWLPCRHGDLHAGRGETSLLLHLRPESVRSDLLRPGPEGSLGELLPRLRREGMRAVSPSGVLGDPTGADAAQGAALLRGMVAETAHLLRTGAVRDDGMLAPVPAAS